ncbi:hypothetical protein TNCV_4647791 [Trichonephila clavipes]|uniref:Uncharacterized protein n=1 Tax=Trichonephila clavipes TaxID=2585209 RepID=A0A8X6STB0_TRICX|nr:hypothetical protein TNCV_4647791 [Trichonephila clavipes]
MAHTCQKQTEPARDGSVGCMRAHLPWERTPPTTMLLVVIHQLTALAQFSAKLKLRSSFHMAGLRPYSESQVMLGSPAIKEPTKKPSRETSQLNWKFP